mgnify:CR=1 FL=1
MRDLKIPEQRPPEKARKPDNAQPKKPSWIRVKAPGGKGYAETARRPHDAARDLAPVGDQDLLEHGTAYRGTGGAINSLAPVAARSAPW